MARPWKDGDSARLMTAKFNEMASQMDSLQEENDKTILPIGKRLDEMEEKLETRLGSLSAKDVGLDKVDNTSDKDKPVSDAQNRAIKWAVEEGTKPMLTSEPVSEDLGTSDKGTTFITGICVEGSNLIISY